MKNYYLPFRTSYAQVDAFNLGNTSWKITAYCRGKTVFMAADEGSLRGHLRMDSAGVLQGRNTNSTTTYTLATGEAFPLSGPLRKVTVHRISSVTNVYVDDVLKGTISSLNRLDWTGICTKITMGAFLYSVSSCFL